MGRLRICFKKILITTVDEGYFSDGVEDDLEDEDSNLEDEEEGS